MRVCVCVFVAALDGFSKWAVVSFDFGRRR